MRNEVSGDLCQHIIHNAVTLRHTFNAAVVLDIYKTSTSSQEQTIFTTFLVKNDPFFNAE